MVRRSSLVLLGLVVMGCSLATAFESGPELIAVAIRAKTLFGRYLQWKRDQPADSDTSFSAFYDWIKGKDDNRQLTQREADDDESSQTYELGHDNGELQDLYQEWKNIQPEGSSVSFETYLKWLKDQRTQREFSADGSDAARDVAIEKRRCRYFCTCCPLTCGFSC